MPGRSPAAEPLRAGDRARGAVADKAGWEEGTLQKGDVTCLSGVLLLIQLGLIPHRWGFWSGLPVLPEPKVLCCHSCFRLTHFLRFPLFLSSRTREQGEVVGQGATLSHEVRRDSRVTQPGAAWLEKAVQALEVVPSTLDVPWASRCLSPSWLPYLWLGSAASFQIQARSAASVVSA